MRKVFLLITFYLFIADVSAQYKIDKLLYFYPYRVDFTSSPFNNVYFTGVKNFLYVYERDTVAPADTLVRYAMHKINLNTGKVLMTVKLPPISRHFMIHSIIADDKFSLIIGSTKLIYLQKGKSAFINHFSAGIDFSSGLRLNDSLVLLHEIYNYHPADGKSGLHMSVFNLNTSKIIKSAFYKFPGVAMGSMTTKWVTNDRQFIYVFAGLSGRVFKYDFDLNETGHQEVPIYDGVTRARNNAYEQASDSLISREWGELREKILENDTAKVKHSYQSDVYGKDFLFTTSGELRGGYSFIEKVLPLNDTLVYLTVSRPGYAMLFRDVFLYHLQTNTVVEKYHRWQTGRKKLIETPEDYYPVDLVNDELLAPYFYKNTVCNFYIDDTKIFRKGPVDSMKALQHDSIMKNGYRLQIRKFTYD